MAKDQLSHEEILKQLPEDIANQSFSQISYRSYNTIIEDQQVSGLSKILNKIKENPFVPLGLGGTVYFLSRGLLNMGNRQVSQRMMRGRVLAQGFTIMALVFGFALEAYREDAKKQEE